MNAKLIERMKAVMAEKQISQAELSKLTGIRASSISDYLNNRYEPKQDKIFLIANALRVNPAWLSGRDSNVVKPPAGNNAPLADQKPEPIVLTADEEGLVTKYRRLSPEGKQTVNQYVDFQLFQESEQKRSAADIA